jgi:hypothetical protein
MPRVLLDREQREILRRLVDVDSQGMADDVAVAITHRDRHAAVEAVGRLEAMVALLDAIGWAEPDGDDLAPHVCELSDAVVGWALRELVAVREWLPKAIEDGEQIDDDLLAVAVLRQVAGT